MTSVPKQIAEKFLADLGQTDEVTAEQAQALRELMEKSTKLKAADVEAVFESSEDEKL
jgi:hypothetical protein